MADDPYIKLKPAPLSTAGITLHWDDGGLEELFYWNRGLRLEHPTEWKGPLNITGNIFDGTWLDREENEL